ncbi:MAG: hypothetical protein ACP5MB_11285 [bacterium]
MENIFKKIIRFFSKLFNDTPPPPSNPKSYPYPQQQKQNNRNHLQEKLDFGKDMEKMAQDLFSFRAPKHWKYKFNLFRPEWRTDIDILITYPFKCVIDIKSSNGYMFNQYKDIVKIKDKSQKLLHQDNLLRQLNFTGSNVIIVWCPRATKQLVQKERINNKLVVLCNGSEALLINTIQEIFEVKHV